ncbi:4-hydroxy-tetrahydrodipicolinate synthase [hydrothermal vent metagenome]|uniref:4-hydroxy-tetrahydrodipicolinate synthase n=1 Tax=hydrothermal vent metagenome TaxID=652676 RepID=A0A3B1CDX3_9ZZZZ
MLFKGSIVAIVTPFKDGQVDEKALVDLINWQIEEGSSGIVPCGSTGESATLTHDEHARVINLCVEVVDKRVSVIAGSGSNSTAEAIELTKVAAKAGADAALLLSPYYNKPTQEGIYQHYWAIADSVDIPQFIYNVPGRTASEVSSTTMARLSEHPNIAGLKEAGGDLAKTADTMAMCGPDFTILSGDDALTYPMMALGAKGVISVTANVAPNLIAALVSASEAGDMAEARRLYFETRELSNAMFYETNPIPVKTALSAMGRIEEEFRLPLCAMSQINKEKLQSILNRMEMI